MADYRVMAILGQRGRDEPIVAALRDAGFADSDMSLLYISPKELEAKSDKSSVVEGAAAGSATGGTLGALGALAALAIPGIGPALGAGILGTAVAGAAAGGVLGAFSQLGLADDLAEQYQAALEGGELIFAIDTPNPDRAADAEHILRDHNASLVNTFQT